MANIPCNLCDSSDGAHEYESGIYCFSCGKFTRIKRPGDYVHPVRTKQIFEGLPMKCTDTLPASAKMWLKKYHLTDEQIDLYRFMYVKELDTHGSRYTNRLIIPSYDRNGILQFFQARALTEGDSHKYVSNGEMSHMFWSRQAKTKTLCIVEDAISAIRVGEVMSAVALCGTTLSDAKMIKILEGNRPLVVWLDGDKPGMNASKKIVNRLSPLAVGGVREVYSPRDPKTYTKDEMESLVKKLKYTKDQYVFRI